MRNKGQVWRQVQAGLKPGDQLHTWSKRDGSGPVFRIEEVGSGVIAISPESSGKTRRLVQGSFDEVIDHLNGGRVRSELTGQNTSYVLGILNHLGIVTE